LQCIFRLQNLPLSFLYYGAKSLEAEYDAKLNELQARHAQEIASANISIETEPTEQPADDPHPEVQQSSVNEQKEGSVSKLEKARRKRDKQRAVERERYLQIEQETANAPSLRDAEIQRIREKHLAPLNLSIQDVVADGHCLYRAVAAQCNDGSTYQTIRE
jgi:OTU domain-containing protein 6